MYYKLYYKLLKIWGPKALLAPQTKIGGPMTLVSVSTGSGPMYHMGSACTTGAYKYK